MNLYEALRGKEIPEEIRRDLTLLYINYYSFDKLRYYGKIIVHRELADEVRDIFGDILKARFPIEKMRLVSEYDWSDDASMADNNSSAFNYRLAVGKSKLSQHAYGRAIDINPLQNPYIKGDLVLPPGAVYDPKARGTLTEDGTVVAAFESRGWIWGGRWTHLKDWHHFEKPQ